MFFLIAGRVVLSGVLSGGGASDVLPSFDGTGSVVAVADRRLCTDQWHGGRVVAGRGNCGRAHSMLLARKVCERKNSKKGGGEKKGRRKIQAFIGDGGSVGDKLEHVGRWRQHR